MASVALVSQFAEGDEAMLLYDMVVEPIGALRVAEHFTVSAGRIARIRQVHDTAPLRAAGFDADLRLVKEHLTAFCAGDFETVATLLADDFSFTGPLRQVDGRDEFLAGAEGLIPIMRGHRLLRQWQDGPEVCSVYELHIESPVGSGSVPMSEWDTVADGRIVTARLLYDTAAFLALAPSPAEA